MTPFVTRFITIGWLCLCILLCGCDGGDTHTVAVQLNKTQHPGDSDGIVFKERIRDRTQPALPAGKAEEFRWQLDRLPEILTNVDESVVNDYLRDIGNLVDQFTMENRERLLVALGPGTGYRICHMRRVSEGLVTNEARRDDVCALAVQRYSRICGTMADWLREKCNNPYDAAEVDRYTYFVLEECLKVWVDWGWKESAKAVEACLAEWRKTRCDDVNSNFCLSHRACERMYNTYYAERIRNGDKRLWKVTATWYRWHLSWARKILGKEPSWAPGK